MADEQNPPPLPTDAPHIQPAPAAVAGPPADPVATPPQAPPFSTAEFAGGLLRSTLYLLIGAAVGAVMGFLLDMLQWAIWSTGDWKLLTGGGLLVGAFFNRSIIYLLHLAPAKQREAQAADAPVNPPPADSPASDGFRETVETLVFVFVVVLLMKTLTAEQYVIPTGSMAETLLGYQKWVVCPECGYRFPANASQQVDDSTDSPAQWVSGCTCPNCRQTIRFVPYEDSYRLWVIPAGRTYYDHPPEKDDRPEEKLKHKRPPPNGTDEIADPPWGGGDQVLVSKFAYDLTGALPDRLDVVVFRFPGNGGFPPSGSFHDGVQINYIKRLVGLPRETIAVHGGDLYALPPDKGLQYDGPLTEDEQEEMARTPGMDPARRLWEPAFMHTDDAEAMKRFGRGEFQIIRKPPETLLAMRRIVYDNDHPARDLTGPAWARWAGRDPEAGWKADDPHGFRLPAPPDTDKDHWLGYRHVLRDQPGKVQLITDFMGYNTSTPHPQPQEDWVGDLILECEVQPDQPQGELTLELSKGVDRFRARFDLATGDCSLWRNGQDKPLESRPTALMGGGKHSVRFGNVDQRLTVWVDDHLPFGDGVPYDPPKTEGPTKENDLQPASVGLRNVGGTVHGLRLWRDAYYTTAKGGHADASDHDPKVDFSDPLTWDGMRNLPTRTMYVQPGHFLCMGDNSAESSDGRFWGLVPQRLLVGKAVAVFYPFDRFGRIR